MVSVSPDERAIWQEYPAWSQFTWLYFFAFLAALRGALFMRFQVPGWEMWVIGAILLLICVGFVRRWAQYVITSSKVAVKNGYTGRVTDWIALDKIRDLSVRQGPIASLFGIGTVVIQGEDGERLIRFRGVKDPEVILKRIEALRPASATA